MKRVFVSDCEGPISKNDNAYELMSHFVPDGDKVFSLISKYDDVLADNLKREGYNAGDTLKLVVPFLLAYDVTDKQMEEFSAQTLVLIPGTKETLKYVLSKAEAFIVSTSYEHYIRALCKATEFPFENAYCTRLSLSKYRISDEEKTNLKEISQEIAAMPLMAIPQNATKLSDFSSRDQQTINRLDEIFWKEISSMPCGKIYSEIVTVGGTQKAQAIRDITKKLHMLIAGVMYVGDSITDVEAFQLVKGNGGLTVSLNGNNYAVRNAELSVMSENNLVIAVLADLFLKGAKESATSLAADWNADSLKKSPIDKKLLNQVLARFPDALPKVQIVTAKNMDSLSRESSEYRKKVRGEAVGKLG